MISDQDLYDAEARMSLVDALAACGVSLSDLAGLDGEGTLHDSHGESIVSYWPTTTGDVEARWHRREEWDDMDGNITCEDGEAVPHAYYSRLDGECIPEPCVDLELSDDA